MGCVVVAAILLPWFVRRSLAHPEPLLDLRLLREPNITAVNLVNIGVSGAGTASWLLYPLFMVQHWGYSVTRAGLALTPFPIVASITGVIAGGSRNESGSDA